MDGTEKNEKAEVKKIPKPNNMFIIEPDEEKDFFKWWCILLRAFVPLTNREIDVMASFLRRRWALSKHISDLSILDTMLMSEDTKKKVQEECNITLQHFYVVMSNLRKNGIIVNNTINPRLIPNYKSDDEDYRLTVCFKKKKA